MATPMASVLEMPKLSAGACKALLGLLSFRNKTTGACFPKFKTLMERLGLTENQERTLYRWLAELKRAGVVVPVKNQDGDRRRNTYVIHLAGLHLDKLPDTGVTQIPDKNVRYRPGILYEQDSREQGPPRRKSMGRETRTLAERTLESYYRNHATEAERKAAGY